VQSKEGQKIKFPGKEGGAEEKGGTEGGTAWARGVIGCGHYVPVGFC
jgi:hypothetical protein